MYNNLKCFIESAKFKRDELGLTKNEQYTFTHYAEVLREKGFDSVKVETMEFLNAFNHFVKETEKVGITHTKINWKKTYDKRGIVNKTYLQTIRSKLGNSKAADLDESLENIQILTKYENDVNAFLKALANYACQPLDMMGQG